MVLRLTPGIHLVVGIAILVGVSACSSTPSTSPEPSPTAIALDADDEACRNYVGAWMLFTKAPRATTQDWVDAYTDLSFATGQSAVDATQGSAAQQALTRVAQVAAASADALKANGGLSTAENLDMQMAVSAAGGACGADTEFTLG